MDIAVHDASHEFDRMVRLEPTGLVGHHRIGRRVRFVETVVGELFQKVENLRGFFLIHPVFRGTCLELGAFCVHRLFDLFTHGAAQQVSATKAIARHDLSDLHHLFLINDDALSFGKDMINRRMNGFKFFATVFHIAIGRDVFHRTRTIQRHKRDDILDTGRLHLAKRRHHARTFNLEHRNRFRSGIEVVCRLIVQRDQVDLVHPALWRIIELAPIRCDVQITSRFENQVHRGLNNRQCFQTEEVEFDQASLFHPFHVELSCGHIGPWILIERHQLIQWSVTNHDTRRVGRCVPEQALNLLAIGQQAIHDLFFAGQFAQAFLLCQCLFDADGFNALNRDQFRQAVHLTKRHLQHAAHVAHRRLGQKRTKGDDLPNFVTAIFFLNKSDRFFAAIHAEVDIEVRHRHTFGVKETFEQQAIPQRIKVGDG